MLRLSFLSVLAGLASGQATTYDTPSCFNSGYGYYGDRLTKLNSIRHARTCMERCHEYRRNGRRCNYVTYDEDNRTCELFENQDGRWQAAWHEKIWSAARRNCDRSPTPKPTPKQTQSMADRSLCWKDDKQYSGGTTIGGSSSNNCKPRYTTNNCRCRESWYDEGSRRQVNDYCTTTPGARSWCKTVGRCDRRDWGYCEDCEDGGVTTRTAEACAEKCVEHSRCNYFNWKGRDRKCELKRSFSTLLDKSTRDGFVSGPQKCNQCYASHTDYEDDSIKVQRNVYTAGACSRECDRLRNCKYFTYNGRRDRCTMFSRITASSRRQRTNVLTAKRGCRIPGSALREIGEVGESVAFQNHLIYMAAGLCSIVALGTVAWALVRRTKGAEAADVSETPATPLLA